MSNPSSVKLFEFKEYSDEKDNLIIIEGERN